MPRFRAKMNSALAVSSAKKCAAKRQEVIFLPHIFLHPMPLLLFGQRHFFQNIRRVVWVEGFRRLTRGRRPRCREAITINLACGHGLNDSNMDRQVVELQGINSSRVEYNSPKRKRGNELGTIRRLRFGLQKRSVSAKTGAVQLKSPVNAVVGVDS